MLQNSKGSQRPDAQPGPSHNVVSVNQTYTRVPAVRTLIPVVPQHKIFILAQRNRLRRKSRALNHFTAIGYMQSFTTYLTQYIRHLSGFSR